VREPDRIDALGSVPSTGKKKKVTSIKVNRKNKTGLKCISVWRYTFSHGNIVPFHIHGMCVGSQVNPCLLFWRAKAFDSFGGKRFWPWCSDGEGGIDYLGALP
jgi:hypothetical protein